MNKRFLLAAALTVTTPLALALPAGADRLPGSTVGGRPLSTSLTGAAEVPGPGDPDGSGSASLTVNPGRGEICYSITVEDIEPATGAHIHEAGAGEAGPVVKGLEAPSDGSSSGCVIDRELARELVRNPSDYYVNVHNHELPAGAVRGQL